MEEAGPGRRRLLRVAPAEGEEAPWPPGAPAAVVRSLAADAAPDEAGKTVLRPVAALEGRRSALTLASPAGEVVLVLLRGRLHGVVAGEEAARLRLEGPAPAVAALADALAATLPLLPATATLPRLGRLLALGIVEVPPRRAALPDVSSEADTDAALASAIRQLTAAMLHQAPRARAELGPEGVHQLRVALRRLRSVIRVFRPVADGAALRALDRQLAALARLLGPARDWDVFAGGLGRAVAAALDGDRRLGTLATRVEAQRAGAYRALRRALDGAVFRRAAVLGACLGATGAWGGTERPGGDGDPQPLPRFAAAVLDRRWQRLRTRGREIAALDGTALHDLRLDAKRLRYGAELLAPLWPGRAGARFLRRLARVQDALGVANDALVARALMAGLPRGDADAAWAAGAVEGFATARAAPARADALAAWAKLAGTRPFWSR